MFLEKFIGLSINIILNGKIREKADVYLKNDYGVQKRIYDELEAEIPELVTYSDLMVFLINDLFKNNISSGSAPWTDGDVLVTMADAGMTVAGNLIVDGGWTAGKDW